MVKFKSSVRFKALTPALMRILEAVMELDTQLIGDIVITSVNDSKHSENSAHYRNEAVDIRCNDRPKHIDRLMVDALRHTLGDKFFVLYEGEGTPNEHIHVQLRKGQSYP